MEDFETIKGLYQKLGPNARSILIAVAERLVVGLAHGDFEKRKDWDKETSEELLDAIVYQTWKTLEPKQDLKELVWGPRPIAPEPFVQVEIPEIELSPIGPEDFGGQDFFKEDKGPVSY